MIGGDPQRALSVLAWAKDASGAELGVLMGALKDSSAMRDPAKVGSTTYYSCNGSSHTALDISNGTCGE